MPITSSVAVSPEPGGPRFVVERARTPEEVRESQELRFLTFQGADDPGARGVDEDRFDPFCDHLLVRDARSGRLVASTRLLREERAREAGGFYSETEFELGSILATPGRFLEVGRTCVHPDARGGATIAVLWTGIAPYLLEEGYTNLFGCASISTRHGFGPIRALAARVLAEHGAPPERHAVPRRPLPHAESPEAAVPCPSPPLLKAYLRLGAEICGEPCWDDELHTADLPILLRRERLSGRYARHFLRPVAAG